MIRDLFAVAENMAVCMAVCMELATYGLIALIIVLSANHQTVIYIYIYIYTTPLKVRESQHPRRPTKYFGQIYSTHTRSHYIDKSRALAFRPIYVCGDII